VFGRSYWGAAMYGPAYWGDGGTGGGPGPAPGDDTQDARRRRARIAMRSILFLLALSGCAHGRFVLSPPLEQHPGNDVLWAGVGAASDGVLQFAKVKPIPRLAIVAGLGVVVRYTMVVDRPRDSGLGILWGAAVVEFVTFVFCRGPCRR